VKIAVIGKGRVGSGSGLALLRTGYALVLRLRMPGA